MPIAKRGSRVITVSGQRFRWKGGTGGAAVTVESLEGAGRRLVLQFDLHHAEPKQVGDGIRWALASGWDPLDTAPPFVVRDGNSVLPEYDLWHAVELGEAAAVEESLRAGADPNTRFQGRSVISLAVGLRKLEVVRLLLNAGGDPNAEEDWPALSLAAGWGDVESTGLLLACGADPNAKDRHGRTPLWRAENNCFLTWIEMGSRHIRQTREDFAEVTRLLREAGAT